MSRDDRVYLNDILESIEKIERYFNGISEEEFLKNEILQDAVLRRIEIIGEAVKNISGETQTKNQNVPWKKIAGTRDVLTHEYFGVNLERIWETVKKDIPELKIMIENIRI